MASASASRAPAACDLRAGPPATVRHCYAAHAGDLLVRQVGLRSHIVAMIPNVAERHPAPCPARAARRGAATPLVRGRHVAPSSARHVVEGSSRFAKDVRIPKAQGEHYGSKTVKGSTRAAPEIHAEIT